MNDNDYGFSPPENNSQKDELPRYDAPDYDITPPAPYSQPEFIPPPGTEMEPPAPSVTPPAVPPVQPSPGYYVPPQGYVPQPPGYMPPPQGYAPPPVYPPQPPMGPGYPPPYQQVYGSPQNLQKNKAGHGFAVTGFILGILSIFVCCGNPPIGIVIAAVALILCIVAKVNGNNTGLAMAGLIITIIAVLWAALGVAFYASGGYREFLEGLAESLQDNYDPYPYY